MTKPYKHCECVKSKCKGKTKFIRHWYEGDCDWELLQCEKCGVLIRTPSKEGIRTPHHWANEVSEEMMIREGYLQQEWRKETGEDK